MKNKKIWLKQLLMSAATTISMFAIFMSKMPCEGKFYQPEVPEQLRK
ncbi:hypothetical protein NE562_12215 [Butyricicoccus faecihominis]|nr:hypothetical protein [Butyricicoccus faecihominis]MCQ5130428.1 hypothetical protein [Butyricicoccus faecihominis]